LPVAVLEKNYCRLFRHACISGQQGREQICCMVFA
jgi:hypothetical protein